MGQKSALVAAIADDIRRLFQSLVEQSKRVEQETGLTGPQLWVVKLLEESSPMKAADLAKRTYLHPATMVGLLDRLEAKGLIQRTRAQHDRRVIHIELTEQGRAIVKNSPEVVQSLLVKGLALNTVPKLQQMSVELKEITKILGIQGQPPKLIMSAEVNSSKRRKKTATGTN